VLGGNAAANPEINGMATVGVFAAVFDEQGRILLVKRNYGPRNWTTPGGRLETGEFPFQALEREVREETGYQIEINRLIGVYSAPFRDDLILFFASTILQQGEWRPGQEISEIRFFGPDELPPLGSRTLGRVQDAFAGTSGVVRVFASGND